MNQIETLLPELLGASLAILALIGMREFIKESSIALKKSSQ
tara:strand:- start:1865 stop:1987 length:123 start_codon:yes stop_codon:yes gene_type:complete